MKRNVFTKDFKLEAVRLLESSGRAASEVARELGIRRNQLYKGQAELLSRGAQAFPGRGQHPEMADELTNGSPGQWLTGSGLANCIMSSVRLPLHGPQASSAPAR